jgi:hypothetical protein
VNKRDLLWRGVENELARDALAQQSVKLKVREASTTAQSVLGVACITAEGGCATKASSQ